MKERDRGREREREREGREDSLSDKGKELDGTGRLLDSKQR